MSGEIVTDGVQAFTVEKVSATVLAPNGHNAMLLFRSELMEAGYKPYLFDISWEQNEDGSFDMEAIRE